MIEIHKDQGKGGNGAFAIVTDAKDYNDYLCMLGEALIPVLEKTEHDWGFTLDGLLPIMFEIAFKMKGYKTDGVSEKTVYQCGNIRPGISTLLGTESRPPVGRSKGK